MRPAKSASERAKIEAKAHRMLQELVKKAGLNIDLDQLKAASEAKPDFEGMVQAKDLAAMAGVTPYEFRAFLRSEEGGEFAEKHHTRYAWPKDDTERIRMILEAFKAWKIKQDQLKAKRAAEREAWRAKLAAEKAAQQKAQ